jgi:hypothetical protein
MRSGESWESRDEEIIQPAESDSSRSEVDAAAWANYRPDGGESGQIESISERMIGKSPETFPEFDPGLPDDRGSDAQSDTEPKEVWRRGEGDVEGEIDLQAQESESTPGEIDDAAWANAAAALGAEGAVSERDGHDEQEVDDSVEIANEPPLMPEAPPPVDDVRASKDEDQFLADARANVQDVFEQRDKELGKPEIEPADFDFREPALEKFELDPESQAKASELGRQLATDFSLEEWKKSDYVGRLNQVTKASLTASSELGLPHVETNTDPYMGEDLLGTSQGDTITLNDRLLSADDPTPIVETLAHEIRHQWQKAVTEGKQEHPVGDSAFNGLVSADISYRSDAYGKWTYAANYMEVDAESFARAVSKAFDDFGR